MKLLLTILFLISFLGLTQFNNLDFYAGPNFNRAYKINQYFKTSDTLSILPGFTAGVHYHIRVKGKRMKWGVSYTYYQGEYENGYNTFLYSGNGSGKYKNHSINLELYPIKTRIKNIEFALGLITSYRFASNLILKTSKDIFFEPVPINNPFNYNVYKNNSGQKLISGLQLDITRTFSFTPSSQIGLKLQIYQGLTKDYTLYMNQIYKTILSPQIVLERTF